MQVAVPRRRDAPVPRAALRVPRGRRRRGRASCSPSSSATGRSATATRSATLDPDRLDVDALDGAGSSATATTRVAGEPRRVRAFFSRPAARPAQLDEFAACDIEQTGRSARRSSSRTSTSAARPTTRWCRGRSRERHQPARRPAAPDVRLRHLPLGRPRHDRARRRGLRARREGRHRASATSASSRSSTRRGCTPAPIPTSSPAPSAKPRWPPLAKIPSSEELDEERLHG